MRGKRIRQNLGSESFSISIEHTFLFSKSQYLP